MIYNFMTQEHMVGVWLYEMPIPQPDFLLIYAKKTALYSVLLIVKFLLLCEILGEIEVLKK